MAKCDRLSVLNVELQNAHVLLSEEWGAARRQYEATLADLRATCDELRSELERSENTARDRSSRIDELEVGAHVFYLPLQSLGAKVFIMCKAVIVSESIEGMKVGFYGCGFDKLFVENLYILRSFRYLGRLNCTPLEALRTWLLWDFISLWLVVNNI